MQLLFVSSESTFTYFEATQGYLEHEVTCVCGVKWRRKAGVAGYRAINSACLLPALVSFNQLSAMKKLR
ncbi:transposase [Klebsiella variicola]|nr:transposase [Klebsiella variicola]